MGAAFHLQGRQEPVTTCGGQPTRSAKCLQLQPTRSNSNRSGGDAQKANCLTNSEHANLACALQQARRPGASGNGEQSRRRAGFFLWCAAELAENALNGWWWRRERGCGLISSSFRAADASAFTEHERLEHDRRRYPGMSRPFLLPRTPCWALDEGRMADKCDFSRISYR
jgi:hypothetical protein